MRRTMNDPIRAAGARHVAELSANSQGLIEKALYMRCQSYLAHVKSQLLLQTIYEVDSHRQRLKKSNNRLSAALERVERQREELAAEVRRRETVEQNLERQGALVSIIDRGLTHYLVERDLDAAFDLILGETMGLLGAKAVHIGDLDLKAGTLAFRSGLALRSGRLHHTTVEEQGRYAGPLRRTLMDLPEHDPSATPGPDQGRVIRGFSTDGDAILVPLVTAPDELRICAFTGLEADPSLDPVAFLEPLTSALGAIYLAARLDEREQAQRELTIRAKEEADAANQSKSRFLANMSHELRTPLNAIAGMCYLLGRGDLSPALREHVDRIELASQSLVDLVDDVLDLSKIEAERLDLEDHAFALDLLLSKALAIAEPKVEASGLELSCERDLALPPQVIGDRVRLLQILTNLLDNAIKFTPKGRVLLRVTKAKSTPESDAVLLRFAVEDTGIGIAPEQLHLLFEPFSQADATTTRRFGGSGLGLAICRRLAERMGGTLAVHSELGQGSTFTLTAPFQSAPPCARTEPNAQRPEPADLSDLRVLVVEDNPMNQLVIEAFLKDFGVAVSLAESGNAAIQAVIRSDGFDAILMDIQMPDMDGYETTRRLRRLPKCRTTPILALTAHVLPEDRRACLAAGMDDHLGKPIHAEELRDALALWTRRSGETRARLRDP